MNSGQLITELHNLNFTVENYYALRQWEGSTLFNPDMIKARFGEYKVVDEGSESADVNTSEYWSYVKGYYVLYFEQYNIYLKGTYYSGSYETEDYKGWFEVFPKTKIVYE